MHQLLTALFLCILFTIYADEDQDFEDDIIQKTYQSCLTVQNHLKSGDFQLAQEDLQELIEELSPSLKTFDDLEKNPYFSKQERKRIKPYLMPNDHPIKPILDKIFSKRALLDADAFAAAGFVTKSVQPHSFIRVASHPETPGYLYKIYLDSELRLKKNTPGWKWFGYRTKNAKTIGDFIKKRKIQYFVVAKKWIYALPIEPSPPSDPLYARKNEILVVEDMNLVSDEENARAWRTVITKEHLDEFYAILTHAGGSSYRIDNVAYTKNGKFAFIDTEYNKKTPDHRAILPHLSPEMAAYWKKIADIH
jgi:hypothetical protein